MTKIPCDEILRKAELQYVKGVYTGPARDLKGLTWEYLGVVSSQLAITPDGDSVDLTKVADANLNDDDYLVLIYTGGTEVKSIPPGTFSEDMRTRLNNIDASTNAIYVMPRHDSELNDLFPLLYPGYRSMMYYDLLREREIIDLHMLNPTAYPPGSFTEFDDQVENLYFDSIERRLRLLGCKGNFPPVAVRSRVLSTKFYETRRNPFREWVESLVWDGKPRVDTWFQRIFNATAPPLAAKGLSDLYMAKVARAWFCGAIARIYKPTVHEIVPVLIGGQGLGKTSGLRYTAVKDNWFIETTVDVVTPKGKNEFLDNVRGRIIVEMSEGAQIRTKDQDRLKAFISMKEDQYRKPYARRDESYPRHFILAASSNKDDAFTDLTGNRRYYPLYCHETDIAARNPYDAEQVWAEAKAMYDKGEHTYISSTWYPAQVMQEYATMDNASVAYIDNYLNNPNNDNGMYTKLGAVITKEEILFKVFGQTQVLRGSPIDLAWEDWTKGSRYWEKTEESVSTAFSAAPIRAYRRVKTSLQDPFMHGTYIKDSPDQLKERCFKEAMFTYPFNEGDTEGGDMEIKYRGMSVLDIYISMCKEFGLRSENSIVPINKLLPGTANLLLDNGLIGYDASRNVYRTIVPIDK